MKTERKTNRSIKSRLERRQIVVLGMHRSGTSAIASLLRALGAYVGTDEELTSPNHENPLGFFERRDVREICDALLKKSGADWWKVSSFSPNAIGAALLKAHASKLRDIVANLNLHGTWAIKEPRLCFLFPVLAPYLRNPVVVLVFRNPLETARSLRRRNGFPTQVGLSLWEAYNIAALRNSARLPRIFVSYNDLIANPARTVDALSTHLKASGAVGLQPLQEPHTIDEFLHRHHADTNEVLDLTTSAQRDLWAALSSGTVERAPTVISPGALLTLQEFEADETARQAAEFERMQALTTERATRDAETKRLSAKFETQNLEVQKLTGKLQARDADAKQLSAQLDAQNLEAQKLTGKLQARDAEAKRLSAKVEVQELEVQELTGKLQARDAEARQLSAKLDAQNLDVQKLTGKLQARDAEAKQLAAKVKARDTETKRLTARLGMREAEISRLTDSISWRITMPLRGAIGLADRVARSSRGYLRLLWWASTFRFYRFTKEKRFQKDEEKLFASALFDREWYLQKYPDVANAGVDPLSHYVRWGVAEGRDPNPLFDSDWYLSRNPDVAAAGANPLAHYLDFGATEGRNPHPDFDTKEYLARYKEAGKSGINPLEHCLRFGKFEGRTTKPSYPPPGDEPPSTNESTGNSPGAQDHAARVAQLEGFLSSKVLNSSFGRCLRKIVAQHFPVPLADALLEDEREMSGVAARLDAHGPGPLVSVVMPTHNRANVISESITSVLEQDYSNWELLICDDASTDNTENVVGTFDDSRIRYTKLAKIGGAGARNAGLKEAKGTIIAYLDSDNFWHPRFLSTMVLALLENPGRSAAYASHIDFHVNQHGKMTIRSFARSPFDHERLLEKNFIDLNTFVHRRELYDCFGGFNNQLTRRQDYDLILKYTWLRDPLHVPHLLTLYQRNDVLEQVTRTRRDDDSCVSIIDQSVAEYFGKSVPRVARPSLRKVTILSWDACRNHFAKPFALAEALSKQYQVQLISFRFFEEDIFPPLRGVVPPFETLYLPGTQFPEYFESMARAVAAIRGEIIYVVKPRLPSLGVALLANQQRGIPIILEINDLETVVSSPRSSDRHQEASLDTVDPASRELLNPYGDLWSQLMDPLAKELPVLVTHNRSIDQHFGHRCLYMRNIKDERLYDPDLYDRKEVRAGLGLAPEDRVILFGGLLRKHKGIYELVELVKRLNDPRYKLLFVGSRPTPDQERLIQAHGDVIRVLPPQDGEAMAKINMAADLVVLWLDPGVPASQYQMPYKATDAFAMKTPIIANDISDFGDLGRQGYLRIVPFGDWDRMIETVRDLLDDAAGAETLREAGRRLYLRQFSYAAARGSFELALHRALTVEPGVLPVARRFADHFTEFYRSCRSGNSGQDTVPVQAVPASVTRP